MQEFKIGDVILYGLNKQKLAIVFNFIYRNEKKDSLTGLNLLVENGDNVCVPIFKLYKFLKIELTGNKKLYKFLKKYFKLDKFNKEMVKKLDDTELKQWIKEQIMKKNH